MKATINGIVVEGTPQEIWSTAKRSKRRNAKKDTGIPCTSHGIPIGEKSLASSLLQKSPDRRKEVAPQTDHVTAQENA